MLWDHMVTLLRTKPEEHSLMGECRVGSALVRHLIAQGCDVNRSEGEFTPLIEAVKYGRWEAMNLLLVAKGVDVNGTNDKGETPLHWVSCKDLGLVLKVEMALKLLEAGATRDPKSASKETPAARAEKNRCFEVKAIIDVLVAGTGEAGLCEFAREKNAKGVFGLLMQGVDSNVQDPGE